MASEGVLGIGELGLGRGGGRAEHCWSQLHVRNLRRSSASTSNAILELVTLLDLFPRLGAIRRWWYDLVAPN